MCLSRRGRVARRSSGPVSAGVRLDDDALILFTSGTTGQPKGVVHTHRSLRARWVGLREHLGLDAYRRTLCLLPTHFGHGLICNCLFPWLSGCDLFIHAAVPARALLGTWARSSTSTGSRSCRRCRRCGGWRTGCQAAAARSLERVFVGSAPLTAQLWEACGSGPAPRTVFNAYGITETGSWLAGTTVAGFTPEDGLVGEAVGGVIRVLEHDEPGAPLDPGRLRAG